MKILEILPSNVLVEQSGLFADKKLFTDTSIPI